jgi:hypothetical protein
MLNFEPKEIFSRIIMATSSIKIPLAINIGCDITTRWNIIIRFNYQDFCNLFYVCPSAIAQVQITAA